MVDTKLVKKAPNILNIMAAKYNLDPEKFKQTVKATVLRPGKDGGQATDEEFMAFLMVANKYDLDPFTNEIYGYPSKRGGIIPVIGVDGYVRKICNHESFNGMEISFADGIVTPDGGKDCPEWCEIKLYRKNVERPIIVREYIDEVFRKLDYANPWQTHTKRMLRHKTIIQAGRVAGFLTGVYDEDEAQRIIEAEAIDIKPAGKPETIAPQALGQEPQKSNAAILTIPEAKILEAGKTFNVFGAIVSIDTSKVGKGKRDITRYVIHDGKEEAEMMKISVWGLPMEGLQPGDKVIFHKVVGTIYKNEMGYVAQTIEQDLRAAVDET